MSDEAGDVKLLQNLTKLIYRLHPGCSRRDKAGIPFKRRSYFDYWRPFNTRSAGLLIFHFLFLLGSLTARAQLTNIYKQNSIQHIGYDNSLDRETSSVVIPPGALSCPKGCVVMSYGAGPTSLIRASLDILDDPSMERKAPKWTQISLASLLTPIQGHILEATRLDSADGRCKAETPPLHEYIGTATDTNIIRVDERTLLLAFTGYHHVSVRVNQLPIAGHCYWADYPVNYVARSFNNGLTWPEVKVAVNNSPGTNPVKPFNDPKLGCGNMDQTYVYRDPYTKDIYMLGGSNACGEGITYDLIYRSTDGGRTWPLLYKLHDPIFPHAITSTPGGIVAVFGCSGSQPKLYYSINRGRMFEQRPLPLELPACGALGSVPLSETDQILPGNLCSFTRPGDSSTSSLSWGGSDAYSNNDFIRLLYSTTDGTGNAKRQVLEFVVVSIPRDPDAPLGGTQPYYAETIEPQPPSTSIFHGGFIERNGYIEPTAYQDAALSTMLWWEEGYSPPASGTWILAAPPAPYTTRYRMITSARTMTATHPLAQVGASGTYYIKNFADDVCSPSPVKESQHTQWGGDFDRGAYFVVPNEKSMYFFTQWTQSPARGFGLMHYQMTNAKWPLFSGFKPVGSTAPLHGSPAPVSARPDLITIFVRDFYGSVSSTDYSTKAGISLPPAWTSWNWPTKYSPAAASWGNGRIDVFAVGLDSRMYHLIINNGKADQSGWVALGFDKFAYAPAAISTGPNRLMVFGVDESGVVLYLTYQDGVWARQWQPLASGKAKSGVAAAVLKDRSADVFVKGLNDHLWHYNSPSGQWQDIGGGNTLPSEAAPAAATWNSTTARLDVFVKGLSYYNHPYETIETAGPIEHIWKDYRSSKNAPWQDWHNIGGWLPADSGPGAISVGGNTYLFALGLDNQLYVAQYQP